jgi:hypothetical protein
MVGMTTVREVLPFREAKTPKSPAGDDGHGKASSFASLTPGVGCRKRWLKPWRYHRAGLLGR